MQQHAFFILIQFCVWRERKQRKISKKFAPKERIRRTTKRISDVLLPWPRDDIPAFALLFCPFCIWGDLHRLMFVSDFPPFTLYSPLIVSWNPSLCRVDLLNYRHVKDVIVPGLFLFYLFLFFITFSPLFYNIWPPYYWIQFHTCIYAWTTNGNYAASLFIFSISPIIFSGMYARIWNCSPIIEIHDFGTFPFPLPRDKEKKKKNPQKKRKKDKHKSSITSPIILVSVPSPEVGMLNSSSHFHLPFSIHFYHSFRLNLGSPLLYSRVVPNV